MIPAILCAIYVVYLYHTLNRERTANEMRSRESTALEQDLKVRNAESEKLEALIYRLKVLEKRLSKLNDSH